MKKKRMTMAQILKLGEIRKTENNLFEAIDWLHALDETDLKGRQLLNQKVDELQGVYSRFCL